MLLSRKPDFLTRIELHERRKEYFKEFTRFNGEFVLIEMNYLERTFFGTPRTDPMYAEATMYILAEIDTSEDLASAEIFPITRAVSWEKYRENFVVYPVAHSNVRSLQLTAAAVGGAFYRIIAGDMAVRVFLSEFAEDPRSGGPDSLLVFWKAAQKFDIDIAITLNSIADVLEEKRKLVLNDYVRGKALLFVDEYAGVHKIYTSAERSSVACSVNESHKKLLELGLSEESIANQAKELALKLLDF